MKYYILYNPLAGCGSCKEKLDALELESGGEKVFWDLTAKSYDELFALLKAEDKLVICGGDGTVNRFLNGIKDTRLENELLYFAAGSGNDFMNDINMKPSSKPIILNSYIKNLPVLSVNGEDYKILNGAGLGVDGYVCSEISRKRSQTNKKVSYIPVALKALFKQYTPTTATVTTDGETNTYKRVWLASAMKGRFFGGGMMIAPDQNRFEEDGTITSIIGHNLSKLKILSLFLLIFKGKHTRFTKYVAIKKCKEVKVEFERPCILQLDGETIPNVTSYTVAVKQLVLDNSLI